MILLRSNLVTEISLTRCTLVDGSPGVPIEQPGVLTGALLLATFMLKELGNKEDGPIVYVV